MNDSKSDERNIMTFGEWYACYIQTSTYGEMKRYEACFDAGYAACREDILTQLLTDLPLAIREELALRLEKEAV